MNKKETINEIKSNISLYKDFTCPDYPDLGIYSNQYSREVLFNVFNNTNFCYTYFDFDKLSVINNVHGKQIGDIALKNALKIIKSCLPINALLGRIGGDEFYIITPNMDKKDVTALYSKINAALEYYSSTVYGLTVTLDTETSLKPSKTDEISYRSVDELSKITEKRVSSKKQKNKKDIQNIRNIFSDFLIELPIPKNISSEQAQNWNTLNLNICAAIKNHLRDLRPSKKFRYKNEHINSEAISIITALNDILELKIKDKTCKETEYNSSIDCDTAKLVYELFSNNGSSLEDLSEEQLKSVKSSFDTLSENLVRDSNSGLLSKSYYNLFLADKLEQSGKKYQFTYFSISGIRPSNSAYGHSFTDIRMQETAKKIVEAVSKERTFNNSTFSFNETDTFLVDQGGGNYILISPMETALSDLEICEITDEVNSYNDINNSNSSFLIASAFENDVSASTISSLLTEEENLSNKKLFVKYARHLKGICNIAKDIFKENTLSGVDDMTAFRKTILACCDYFVNYIDNADDIATKKFFLHNIFTSLVNHSALYNKEADNKENPKNIIQEGIEL